MELRDEAPPVEDGGEEMRAPDEVAAMLRLRALGWGTRRIAAELGCNRKTVRRYLAAGGWAPYRAPERPGRWPGTGRGWPSGLRRHRGNADVVRQELAAELGIAVSLRTVERAVAAPAARARGGGAGDGALRDAAGPAAADRLRRAAGADRRRGGAGPPVRGHAGLLRRRVYVARLPARAAVGVARRDGGRLPPLRRRAARAAARQRQGAGRAPRRARPARWRSTSACTPSPATGACGRGPARPTGPAPRARTSAASATSSATPSPAGASPSWAALEAHLARWMREVADTRVHGTTGEAPIARFEREEAAALRPLAGRPPFRQLRELTRRVQNDGCVDVDTNHYSVPWRADRRPGQRRRQRRRGAGPATRARRWRATGSGGVGASAPSIRPTCAGIVVGDAVARPRAGGPGRRRVGGRRPAAARWPSTSGPREAAW